MPANTADIARFLASPVWLEGEKAVIRWQFHWWFDDDEEFKPRLWDAIEIADEHNLARLEAGFPVEVAAFRAWRDGDLGERLRAAGLGI
jgi:hypothetical protein